MTRTVALRSTLLPTIRFLVRRMVVDRRTLATVHRSLRQVRSVRRPGLRFFSCSLSLWHIFATYNAPFNSIPYQALLLSNIVVSAGYTQYNPLEHNVSAFCLHMLPNAMELRSSSHNILWRTCTYVIIRTNICLKNTETMIPWTD